MPSLDEVTQTFVANTEPYIAALKQAAAAARDFAQANRDALASMKLLQDEMGGTTSSALALTSAEGELTSAMHDKTAAVIVQSERIADLRAEMGLAYLASQALAMVEQGLGRQLAITAGLTDIMIRATGDLAVQSVYASMGLATQEKALTGTGKELMLASEAAGGFGRAEYDLIMVMAEKTGAASRQGSTLSDLAGNMGRATLAADMLGGAERRLALSTAAAAAAAAGGSGGGLAGLAARTGAAAAATARTGGMIAQFWAQWGALIHWIVMGVAEIAATAIPALVALGAAAAAMYPTFTHIADQMNYLRAATGSWSGVMANSVGPLQAAGAASVRLRQAVAPDAYIIFGAAINAITGHVGAFSQIARQASNVLAAFATKISTELSGPMGGQLTSFFKSAVTDMTQWGQVLGNLGHIFVNVMGAFWGTSRVLLQGLVQITRVLVDITSNPVVAWFIGLASAMSFVYRWAILLRDAFRWLGGPAAFAGIRAAITWVRELAATFVILRDDIGTADAMMALFEASIPTLTAVFFILTAAAAIYLTISNKVRTSTDNLIASIDKMPPTASNMALGMQLMEGNLETLYNQYNKLNPAVVQSYQHFGRFGTAVDNASRPLVYNADAINKSIAEMKKLANESVNLITGLTEAGVRTGQVGAAMQAMSIQTAIADSKIQQVNQALDQYIGLLVSGTAGNADFITSMANIGTVSATTTNNLGTHTGQMSLNATQFGRALTQMGTVGAAAWQNFDQVLSGSMQPLMDNLRQLGVVGALTGRQITTAAIDMAAQLGHYAGSNKTAQAAIMGFLRAQGLTFPSFRAFMRDAAGAHAGQKQLNRIVDAGTIAFSNLSQMAKNAATAMNPMVAQAVDAAALKASGFNTALSKMQTDMLNHAPAATIQADMQAVNNSYQTALTMAERVGQGIQTSGQKAASSTKTSTQTMGQAWGQAKLKQLALEQQTQTSGQAISTHTHGAASQVQAAMATMSTAFDAAKQHAFNLQNYIDSMHGKTITVNTVFTTSGSPGTGVPGVSNPKNGQHGMTVGFAGGGMVGGGGGVDMIHAMLTAGEAVLTARAVAALGGPMAIHTLNNQPSQAVLTSGGGGGGGAGAMALDLKVNSYLDGNRVASASRREYLIYTRRNPRNNLTLRVR